MKGRKTIMTDNFFEIPFIKEMCKTTANMYRLGWDERNGGNISYLLEEWEVKKYFDEYNEAIINGTIPYIENATESTPGYLKSRNASFAEFKKRKGYDDKVHVFDIDETQLVSAFSDENTEFRFINPFLILLGYKQEKRFLLWFLLNSTIACCLS